MLTEIRNKRQHYFVDENNMRQGEYKEWYDNGQMSRHCFYVNGKLHGEYKSWHNNGHMFEHCIYVNGELHGEFIKWLDCGKVILFHAFYDNGKGLGRKVFDYIGDDQWNNGVASADARLLIKLRFGLPTLSFDNT